MQTGRYYLTKYGEDLMALGLTGEQILFTRFEIGDGEIENEVEMYNMNALKNSRQSYPTVDVVADYNDEGRRNGEATISTYMNNVDVEETFFIKEAGVFAMDPIRGEILYAVASYKEMPSPFRAFSVNATEILHKINVIVGNANNLEVFIDRNLVCINWGDWWKLAGKGWNGQTIKNNWDLIMALQIKISMINIQINTGNTSGQNIKIVSASGFPDTTTFVSGIWDKENGRVIA